MARKHPIEERAEVFGDHVSASVALTCLNPHPMPVAGGSDSQRQRSRRSENLTASAALSADTLNEG